MNELENQTNGVPAHHKVVWSFIPVDKTRHAFEHWIGYLANTEQILRLYSILPKLLNAK
jgi:hypothetical protein